MADHPIIQTLDLTVTAQSRPILSGVNITIPTGRVFGILGPSGAGKTTLLRCLNRLAELTPGFRVSGQVRFNGSDINAPETDVDALRARIGILFQQPVIFPRSILANAAFGVRHLGKVSKRELPAVAERALREAALWDEVKDRLHTSALRLSTGQQQRLCLARTLASQPEVLLMDEPTSALDPKSTEAIEDLILQLRGHHTIVLVTHNLRQALKLCDRAAALAAADGCGRLIAESTAATIASQTYQTEFPSA